MTLHIIVYNTWMKDIKNVRFVFFHYTLQVTLHKFRESTLLNGYDNKNYSNNLLSQSELFFTFIY